MVQPQVLPPREKALLGPRVARHLQEWLAGQRFLRHEIHIADQVPRATRLGERDPFYSTAAMALRL